MDALIFRDVSAQVWIVCLATSGALCALYFAGAAWWQRRCRRRAADPPGTVRVCAHVCAHPGTDDGALIIERRGQRYRVDLTRVALRRRLAPGARVIVDGLLRVVPRGDQLYREPARWIGLDAQRVIVGAGALRWLRVPVALACLLWLLSLAQLVFAPRPAGRLFDPAPAPAASGCDRPCTPSR
jgi:hypothetical protein